MDTSFEDQIRERAYQIWLTGGMPEGQAHDHWVCAEQALRVETTAQSAEADEPVVIITKVEKKAAKPRKAAGTRAEKPAAVAKTTRPRKVKAAEMTVGH